MGMGLAGLLLPFMRCPQLFVVVNLSFSYNTLFLSTILGKIDGKSVRED